MMDNLWTTCEGTLNRESGTNQIVSSRRGFLTALSAGALGALLTRSALGQVVVSKEPEHTLVVVFLRGGADGLSLVAPYGDDHYHRKRPNLALKKAEVLDIDGYFGMHPALRGLHELYLQKRLAIVHAVGSQDTTRSHFEAMRTMEYGVSDGRTTSAGGWIARYLEQSESGSGGLRAVAFGGVLPDSLRGSPSALNLSKLSDLHLNFPASAGEEVAWLEALSKAWSTGNDELAHSARSALRVLDVVRSIKTETSTQYPDSDLGRGLQDVATLIRAGVGLEVACLDRGAWDTHAAQGTTTGWLAGNLADLSTSLSAFVKDMGSLMSRCTVVVQTEFGRRVEENVVLGTDHGRASTMFVVGEGFHGLRGFWPGLGPDQLDEVGDLRVGTDYRNVLAEVLKTRMRPVNLGDVFSGMALQPLELS